MRRAALLLLVGVLFIQPARAMEPEALRSVVSVLPIWPNSEVAGAQSEEPEGSAVAIGENGLLATVNHVVGPAREVFIRLSDGRIYPVAVEAADPRSDIALLRLSPEHGVTLPVVELAPMPTLFERVCAVGNPFGLDLSVSCGIVSAIGRSGVGFNEIEDFVQTDAAVNPGFSGGALLDEEGRLVGLLSAIFTKRGDADIGVNFAVSAPLLARVVDELQSHGTLRPRHLGARVAPRATLDGPTVEGARVVSVARGGPADVGGLRRGDIVTHVGPRRIANPIGFQSAFYLYRLGEPVTVGVVRDGVPVSLTITPKLDVERETAEECPAPAPVCAVRAGVYRVRAYDPMASAVMIAPEILVTNRHVVADMTTATVWDGAGRGHEAEVIPNAYPGDMVLLRVPGLEGRALPRGTARDEARVWVVAVDIHQDGRIRVFDNGDIEALPTEDKPLARIHHGAESGPGTSGGALVDARGRLVGIVASGGEGRNEAIPAAELDRLEAMSGPEHRAESRKRGAALRSCAESVEGAGARPARSLSESEAQRLIQTCLRSGNRQLIDLAAQFLGRAGYFEDSIALFRQALARDPNAVNTRLGLAISQHLAGRYADAADNLEQLLEAIPEEPQVARLALQAGHWAGRPDLVEKALSVTETHHPDFLPAAEAFLEADPPAPQRK